jgi:hypothetical protein
MRIKTLQRVHEREGEAPSGFAGGGGDVSPGDRNHLTFIGYERIIRK